MSLKSKLLKKPMKKPGKKPVKQPVKRPVKKPVKRATRKQLLPDMGDPLRIPAEIQIASNGHEDGFRIEVTTGKGGMQFVFGVSARQPHITPSVDMSRKFVATLEELDEKNSSD